MLRPRHHHDSMIARKRCTAASGGMWAVSASAREVERVTGVPAAKGAAKCAAGCTKVWKVPAQQAVVHLMQGLSGSALCPGRGAVSRHPTWRGGAGWPHAGECPRPPTDRVPMAQAHFCVEVRNQVAGPLGCSCCCRSGGPAPKDRCWAPLPLVPGT